MAFTNEYVSDQDIKKYDLARVWMTLVNDTPLQYIWTVDREQNAFLIGYARGREEFANHHDFAFWWDGEIHKASLISNYAHGELENVTTTWQLIGIDCATGSKHTRDQVVALLKESLRAYQVSGAITLIENHAAIFNF
jgi:hypothetical protein